MPKACQTYRVDSFRMSNIRRSEKYVYQMQRRLDKAVASNDKRRIRWIVALLSKRSRAVKVLAVYHITVENEGRYTAGVDGVCIKREATRQEKEKQRHELLTEINVERRPKPIRRVYIDKGNGKKRPLGIPTLQDRINQDIIRMAIEPITEYHFHGNSYGFRPKRGCQDAIQHLFIKLSRRSSPQWNIEGDIKGCFDNIRHEQIIQTMFKWDIPRPIIEKVKKMLKTKISYGRKYYKSETGTPQGGVLSPLLANVAPTTLDNICEQYGRTNPIIRYADDFVVVSRDDQEAQRIKDDIGEHLREQIGLSLSTEKTNITHISKGFNFLGFNIRKYNDKLLIKPQQEKSKEFLREISEILKANKTTKPEAIIQILNLKIQGFALYYRFMVSRQRFSKIQWIYWGKLWRWARRRHPNKPHKWIKRKYFARVQKDRNVFTDGKGHYILNMSKIPIVRYIKVRSDMRVYGSDKQTREYWRRRATVNVLSHVYSVKMEKLLKKQKGKCPYCDQLIEEVKYTHIHHMRPRSEAGKDKLNNLRLLHLTCHEELHTNISRKQMGEFNNKRIDYARSYFVQEYLKKVA